MAYNHQLIEYTAIANATAAAPIVSLLTSGTGEKARVAFGAQNYVIRAVSVMLYASSTTAKPILSLRLSTKAGVTSATGMQFGTLTVPVTKAAGSTIMRGNFRQAAPAGSEFIVHVLTAATKAIKARVSVMVEPDWDTKANMANVTTVTG